MRQRTRDGGGAVASTNGQPMQKDKRGLDAPQEAAEGVSGHLAKLAEKAPAAGDFLSPGDEVKRSVEDDARTHGRRQRQPLHNDLVSQTLPKGRNFH